MALARANPYDSPHRAKALTWDERKAEWERVEPWNLYKENVKNRMLHTLMFVWRENMSINESHFREMNLLSQRQGTNLRIATPNDGFAGQFQDRALSGDSLFVEAFKKRHKLGHLGPKTDIVDSSIFKDMSKYTNTIYYPQHIYDNDRDTELEEQFVTFHMKILDINENDMNIVLTDDQRYEIKHAISKEFYYLLNHPNAMPKRINNLIEQWPMLGKPGPYDAPHIDDKTLSRVEKLRSKITIQNEIKKAIEIASSVNQYILSIRTHPQFTELTPSEQQEYIKLTRNDMIEQYRSIDTGIQISLDEMKQIRKQDIIDNNPNIPLLPLPRILSHNLLEQIPTMVTSRGIRLHDTRKMAPQCFQPALGYIWCLGLHEYNISMCQNQSYNYSFCQAANYNPDEDISMTSSPASSVSRSPLGQNKPGTSSSPLSSHSSQHQPTKSWVDYIEDLFMKEDYISNNLPPPSSSISHKLPSHIVQNAERQAIEALLDSQKPYDMSREDYILYQEQRGRLHNINDNIQVQYNNNDNIINQRVFMTGKKPEKGVPIKEGFPISL